MNKTIGVIVFSAFAILATGMVLTLINKNIGHGILYSSLILTSVAIMGVLVSNAVRPSSGGRKGPTRYGCDRHGKCVEMSSGKYTDADCGGNCPGSGSSPSPTGCSAHNAQLSTLTCSRVNSGQALDASQLKKDHLYLRYYSREPTISDKDSGGNYLAWIYNQVNAMQAGDILMMQTDFFHFDGSPSFEDALRGACEKGAFVYLINDRWQTWGCPFPNNWGSDNPTVTNCDSPSTTYQGKLPANNNCQWIDGIISNMKDQKNFILVDLAGGCGGTGSGSCKQPGCPNYENKPSITTQTNPGEGATARGNPVHAHRKIVSFYSAKRNVGSVYKGSMNVQTSQTGTEGVREVGWGITGLLNDPFMKAHLQHDLNCVEWFFPGGVIPDYGYKIKANQSSDNQSNADLGAKLKALGPQYPKGSAVKVTLNWSTPDFTQIDNTPRSSVKWVSGVDPNVTVRLAINPPGKSQAIPLGTFNDAVDLLGNVKGKGPAGVPSWAGYQKDMTTRTGNLTWTSASPPPFAEGSTWGGTLILKMISNAIKNKSKYLKIHMYNYFYSSFRPCADNQGTGWADITKTMGYSPDGVSGKGADKGKTVASLEDPLPMCGDGNSVDSDSWHNNLQPEFARAMYDYMNADVGKLLVVSGTPMRNQDTCCLASWCGNTKKCMSQTTKACSSDGDCSDGQPPTDLNSYILLQLNKAGPQYDTGAAKNQYWRWYTLGANANCNAEQPSSGQFCKSHEKLWFTDSDVLIASGHPTRGYYADFNSICDDILFENAYSFVDAYNNMYNRIWSNHSVGPVYTGGKTGTGPTNPNWGTWSGSIGDITWKPPEGGAMSPINDTGCASCFGTMDSNNGHCTNSNSSSHEGECLYNLGTS